MFPDFVKFRNVPGKNNLNVKLKLPALHICSVLITKFGPK